jgi:hypothetical protein
MTTLETIVLISSLITMSLGWSYAFYKASQYKPISDEEIVEIDEII